MHTEIKKTTYKAIMSRPMGLDMFHLKPAMEKMTLKTMRRIVT